MKAKTFGQVTSILVALGFAIAPAQAQQSDEALWKKLDFNPDGSLDGKELEGGWLKFDADGNNFLRW